MTWLNGRKTYALAILGVLLIVLKAAYDALNGTPVDWVSVIEQAIVPLIGATIRHGIATEAAK